MLIDCDLRRGQQHKALNCDKISEKDFFSLRVENMKPTKENSNLYLIPKITNLHNQVQFLYSLDFENKINYLKDSFDYVIIDSPPLLSVSDTSILSSFAELHVAVVRHEVTRINEIKQMNNISKQLGFDFDGFIYNAYKKPTRYYGYYGLYGNYAYEYYAKKYLYDSYEYEK